MDPGCAQRLILSWIGRCRALLSLYRVQMWIDQSAVLIDESSVTSLHGGELWGHSLQRSVHYTSHFRDDRGSLDTSCGHRQLHLQAVDGVPGPALLEPAVHNHAHKALPCCEGCIVDGRPWTTATMSKYNTQPVNRHLIYFCTQCLLHQLAEVMPTKHFLAAGVPALKGAPTHWLSRFSGTCIRMAGWRVAPGPAHGCTCVSQCLLHMPPVECAQGSAGKIAKARNLAESWGLCGKRCDTAPSNS